MTYTGTSHFVSFAKALRYYRAYGETSHSIREKLAAGAISIGKPMAKRGESVALNAQEGRYVICSRH